MTGRILEGITHERFSQGTEVVRRLNNGQWVLLPIIDSAELAGVEGNNPRTKLKDIEVSLLANFLDQKGPDFKVRVENRERFEDRYSYGEIIICRGNRGIVVADSSTRNSRPYQTVQREGILRPVVDSLWEILGNNGREADKNLGIEIITTLNNRQFSGDYLMDWQERIVELYKDQKSTTFTVDKLLTKGQSAVVPGSGELWPFF